MSKHWKKPGISCALIPFVGLKNKSILMGLKQTPIRSSLCPFAASVTAPNVSCSVSFFKSLVCRPRLVAKATAPLFPRGELGNCCSGEAFFSLLFPHFNNVSMTFFFFFSFSPAVWHCATLSDQWLQPRSDHTPVVLLQLCASSNHRCKSNIDANLNAARKSQFTSLVRNK